LVDVFVLALLWAVVVVPVGMKAFRNRRDSIAEFERALDSLQPHGWTPVIAPPPIEIERLTGAQLTLRRRRRVAVALAAFAALTAIGAAVIQTRAALAAGALALHMSVAYAAAIVAVDRRAERSVPIALPANVVPLRPRTHVSDWPRTREQVPVYRQRSPVGPPVLASVGAGRRP
jgi:hypothetical protein